MADIASLGLSITSAPAKVAAADLAVFTTAAVNAEAAATKLGVSSAKAAKSSKDISAAAKEAGQGAKTAAAGIDALAQANDNAARAIDKTKAALAGLTAAEAGNNASSRSMRSEDVVAYGNALDDLRAKYNPLFAVGRQYKAQVDEIATAEKLGAISAAEAAMARQRASEAATGQMNALNRLPGAYAAVGTSVKLTSNQLLNLSRQGNDVATMWLMGADASQIAASQFGQIYGVLEEGPGGLRGSLKALGAGLLSLITPTSLVAAGLVAAVGGAVYFATRGQSAIKPLNEAMEAHRKIIEGIADEYGVALSASKKYADGASGAFSLRSSASELRLSARSSLLDGFGVGSGIITGGARTGQGRDAPQAAEAYKAFEAPLLKLRADLKAGKEDASGFIDAIAEIANQDPANQTLQKLAKELVDLANPAAAAQRQIESLTASLAKLRNSQLSESVGRLSGFIPDRTTNRDKINAEADNASGLAQSYGAVLEIERKRSIAIAEIDRQEGVVRKGRELDLQAVGARTVAEQALIASERERLALSGENLSQSEQAARIAQQSALIVAQANRAAEDTLRSSRSQNSSAGLQGYQAGAQSIIDRYAIEIEQANGAADAVAKLTEARNLDLQTLQIQTQRSLFQPQRDQLASLQAEAAAVGASDDVRRRLIDGLKAENDIRQAGINTTGEQADAYRRNAAALSDYEDRVRKAGEAWDDVKKSGESAIDGLVGSISSGDLKGALKGIVDDVAKTALQLAVANPLKNALLGTNYGTMSDLFNGPGDAPALGMPGVQSTASMQVTAAVVNIGGAGLGSLMGGAGQPAGAGGAIDRLLNPANGNAKANTSGAPADVVAYIRQAAGQRGIDAETALRVIKQESGFNINAQNLSSKEQSYGLMQLNTMGGLGVHALEKGINVRDPSTWRQQVDFGLDTVKKDGWRQWYGARDVGIGRWDGIGGKATPGGDASSALAASSTKLAASATDFTTNFDQSASAVTSGFGQIADSIVPGLGGVLQNVISTLSNAAGGGGSGGGAGTLIGGIGKLLGFADGTDSAPGGLAMVGERGPELMNVPRGAQIIPNHVLSSMSQARNQQQQQQQTSQSKQVTLGVRIDEETGSLMPFVKKIADEVSESKRGSFVGQSAATATKAVRNNFGGMLNEYQTRRA